MTTMSIRWRVRWRESRVRCSRVASSPSLCKKADTVNAKAVPTLTITTSRRAGEKRNGKWKGDEPGILFVKSRRVKEGKSVFVAP